MACLPPLRPWLSPDLRVFGFEAPRRFRILLVGRLLSCTSTPPQRLSTHASPTYSRLMPTMIRSRKAPRYVLSALQRLRIQETPLFAFLRRRPADFALPTGGPARGFGYPFSGLKFPSPRKPLSAPNAPGLRSSEPFSGTMIGARFPKPLSALALFHETHRLRTGASAAWSHRASRTPHRYPNV